MEELINKFKILIIYGNRKVDENSRNGEIEKIIREKEDTAHYFYMLEFLKEHLKDEVDLQKDENKRDVNTIFFEMQKLGHIVFAENTSKVDYKSGIMYMPKECTEKQKNALKILQKKLKEEDYNIVKFFNLHRDENGILSGNQKIR